MSVDAATVASGIGWRWWRGKRAKAMTYRLTEPVHLRRKRSSRLGVPHHVKRREQRAHPVLVERDRCRTPPDLALDQIRKMLADWIARKTLATENVHEPPCVGLADLDGDLRNDESHTSHGASLSCRAGLQCVQLGRVLLEGGGLRRVALALPLRRHAV